MFDLFRSRAKSVRILLGVILSIVALSMVWYLVPTGDQGFGTDQNLLATVGSEKITMQTAQQAISAQTRGRQVPQELLSFYAPQIVQNLISERALAYEAARMGLHVSDDDVAAAIRAQLPPQFIKKDGAIDQDLLASALSQQGMTIPQYIEEMRRGMLVNRLRKIVQDGVVVTKGAAEQEYRLRNEKVKVEYVLIKPAMFDQQVQVTPAEVQAFYDKSKAAYQTPEKRSYAVVLLDSAKLQAAFTPSDAELQAAYNSSLDRFRSPERVKVRHMLLKTDSAKKDDAQVEAKTKDLLKQLQGGADFAELAKKNSQDTVSAAKGGELDWVVRGQTVKPFEDAAFSLKPGELSGLVKTMYGYHILQVQEKEPARVKPFSEVRETLISEVKNRKAAEQMQQFADRAAAALRKDPAHPEKAAAEANGELIRADNIKSGDPIPQVGTSPEFQNALNGLKQGQVSAPASLPGNKVAVTLVTAVSPAHPSPLNEVRAQVETSVRQQKISELVQKRANDLAARAKAAGGDLEKAAKELGLELKTSNDFDRHGAVEGLGSASSISEAFTAKDGAIVGPAQAADGRAVVKVLSHTPADMSGFSGQQKALVDELKGKLGRERLALFEDGVRQRLETEGKIKIRMDTLNRLTQAFKG